MGIIWDLLVALTVESFPPKPVFTVQDIPNLSGQVILVTGGNSGIGFETVKELVKHGAKVYMAARSRSKAEEAIAAIHKDTGKSPVFLELDLANLDSVKKAAETFLQSETRLDVLYNNAGIMIPPLDQVTRQRYDLQFGLVLGHFYLTKLLLPVLLSAAHSTPGGKARIINVSSAAHHFTRLNFATFKEGPERRKCSTHKLYAQSKFGMVVLSAELARRYGEQGIVSIAMNPGNVRTPLQRELSGIELAIGSLIMYPVLPNGIISHLWAGTALETSKFNGKYIRPWARLGEPRRDTQYRALGKDLWTWLEEQLGDR
ncbi:NAD-P-binding protein [Mycena capillaripes]|nr:NAD-P-binding protein [Mycena capillaripes]